MSKRISNLPTLPSFEDGDFFLVARSSNQKNYKVTKEDLFYDIGSTTRRVDSFDIMQQHIDEKKVTLTYTPALPDKTLLFIQGAITQVVNIDFVVVGNEVRWNALGLESIIALSQKLIVEYFN